MKLFLLGYNSSFELNPSFWDKAEDISGGYIIQREIEKAVKGKPFFINDEETKKPIRFQGVSSEEFFYYYKVWEDFHVLRVLPHGKGTLDERPWTLDLIKAFERAYKDIEIFIENKMNKSV